MRPDGTKAELFYKSPAAGSLISRGRETADRHYVFIEKQANGASRVIAIDQHRPRFSANNLSEPFAGSFYAVFPLQNQQYLVAYQEDADKNIGLYQMDLQHGFAMDLIYSNPDYHAVEAVIVRQRVRPKNLPSRIEEGEENGTILCLDADLSEDSIFSSLNSYNTFSVEVQDISKSLGRVPVAADGSFYIEVPADEPIRFLTFNNDGQLIRGPSDWIWVRPQERRGCIGCHEDKELTPENRVPLAVKKKPINLTRIIKASNSE